MALRPVKEFKGPDVEDLHFEIVKRNIERLQRLIDTATNRRRRDDLLAMVENERRKLQPRKAPRSDY